MILHPTTQRQPLLLESAPVEGQPPVTIQYTYFPGGKYKPDGYLVQDTPEKLRRWVASPPETDKHKDYLPQWAFGTFKDNHRCAANAESFTLLVLDFDKNSSLEEIVSHWAGVAGLAHTSSSHTPEYQRWRVLVFISRPITPAEYKMLAQWARSRAGLTPIDPQVDAISQPWIMPVKRPGHIYQWAELKGRLLDVDAILAECKSTQPEARRAPIDGTRTMKNLNQAQGALKYALKAIKDSPSGEHHNTLFKMAIWMARQVGAGLLDEEATKARIIQTMEDAGWDMEKHMVTVEDAFKRGMAEGIKGSDAPDADTGAEEAEDAEPWAEDTEDTAPGAAHDDQGIPGQEEETAEGDPADAVCPIVLPVTADQEQPLLSLALVEKAIELGGDNADARLFATIFRGRVVYDPAEKQWYTWAGHWWAPDSRLLVPRLFTGALAHQYARHAADFQFKANACADNEEKSTGLKNRAKYFEARAKGLQYTRTVEDVLKLAKGHLTIDNGKWDANPWLLGVANGVVDLRTGEFCPGRPMDWIRTAAPTFWEGIDAPAPRWEQFVAEIVANNSEVAGFLRRTFGYGTSGSVAEQILLILCGDKGSNGKDTMLETLGSVLGTDLASPIPKEVYLRGSGGSRGGEASPQLMTLRGKRIVWAAETGKNATFNEEQVKLITGGGTITARALYQNQQTFAPTHLPILETNERPKAPGDDLALWRRLILVEFTQRFVIAPNPTRPYEKPIDKQLREKLAAEAPGILAWLVRGCLEWQEAGGLNPPEAVRLSTQEYQQDQDLLGQFLSLEAFCRVNPGHRETGKALHACYSAWLKFCIGIDHAPNLVTFGKMLKKKDSLLTPHHTNAGNVYSGIELLATPDEIEEMAMAMRTPGGAAAFDSEDEDGATQADPPAGAGAPEQERPAPPPAPDPTAPIIFLVSPLTDPESVTLEPPPPSHDPLEGQLDFGGWDGQVEIEFYLQECPAANILAEHYWVEGADGWDIVDGEYALYERRLDRIAKLATKKGPLPSVTDGPLHIEGHPYAWAHWMCGAAYNRDLEGIDRVLGILEQRLFSPPASYSPTQEHFGFEDDFALKYWLQDFSYEVVVPRLEDQLTEEYGDLLAGPARHFGEMFKAVCAGIAYLGYPPINIPSLHIEGHPQAWFEALSSMAAALDLDRLTGAHGALEGFLLYAQSRGVIREGVNWSWLGTQCPSNPGMIGGYALLLLRGMCPIACHAETAADGDESSLSEDDCFMYEEDLAMQRWARRLPSLSPKRLMLLADALTKRMEEKHSSFSRWLRPTLPSSYRRLKDLIPEEMTAAA